ncbi:hypothetical protein D3C80_1112770 [compost metagenome]
MFQRFHINQNRKMKKSKLLLLALVGVTFFSSCSNNDDTDPVTPPTADHVLTGDVTKNTTITADKAWTLKGYVYVKDGATLTIEPGAIIKSDVLQKGALIVERGGKLMAEGTAAKPIVFTSGFPKGQRRPGDWGGIILLGKATTNQGTEVKIEGGVNRSYGGNVDNDNSGILKYVRIEFAGIAAEPNSEINGLTCGGVGSGTVIDYVMVSYGNDDAFEFFGGTVSPKHLIAYTTSDDDFDFDFGFSGTLQYAIAARNPLFVDAADAGNGVECDNDGNGTTSTPTTKPVLKNLTIIGPNNQKNTAANHNFGLRWRRSTSFDMQNSILLGSQTAGFSIESANTATAYKNGTAVFKNNIIAVSPLATAVPLKLDDAAKGVISLADFTAKVLADGNITYTDQNASVQLESPFIDPTKAPFAPNFAPKAGSDAATKKIGAIVDGNDWTQGWTNWNPTTTEY